MTTIQQIATLTFALSCTATAATTLGTVVSIADPVLGNRSIVYQLINGYAIVEGDIIIGKIVELNSPSAVFRPTIGGNRWHEGIIPFELEEDLPLMTKLAVLQAIAHWQKHTALQFVELTSKNRHEYHDYLAFIPAPGTTCSSYVGKKGGRQEVNLSTRCTNMNTVHEIGHAIGLWHEQSRADRDNYIRIVWENIDEDHQYNFNQHLTDGRDVGDYDYQSIMHYGAYAFSKNGKKTIMPLDENVEIGQRNQLSEKDIQAVSAMYPDAIARDKK